MPIEETENEIRVRVRPVSEFDENSLRRVAIAESQGIFAIMGCPKNHYKKGKCQVGMKLQAYRFDKEKWTMEKVKEWLKEHVE